MSHRSRSVERAQISRTRDQTMNDRLVEVETLCPVHEGPGRAHGQGPRTGTQVIIRGATPRDGDGLRGMFSRVSTETIYRRFHIPYPQVPERMLALMLDVDGDKESLVAVAEEEIVGHAMFVRHSNGSEAEMAIIVEDRWQSKGVGTLLLSELAQRARHRGIEVFTGEVLGENHRMLRLADLFAGTSYTIKGALYHVRMPLRPLEPATYPARPSRRAA